MSQMKAQVDKLLTNVSNGYFPTGYIADKILPELSVKQKSGIIGAYGNEHIRIEDDLIGGRAEARRVDAVSRKTDKLYLIKSHALEGVVTEDDYANVEEPFDAESDETTALTHLILTNKEKALADNLFSTSVITQNTSLSGGAKWSAYSTSTPLTDFKTAQNTVLDGCGMMPNAAIISQKVMNTLQYHPGILSTLGYAQNRAGQLSVAEIAKAMGVEELLIGNVAYNASKKGQADSFGQLWGDAALFYVKPKGPAKMQISLGYKMKLSGKEGRQVYRYALNNPPNSNAFIVKDDYSFELVNIKAAYLVATVL
jgi:hypothetical protein